MSKEIETEIKNILTNNELDLYEKAGKLLEIINNIYNQEITKPELFK